VTLSGVGIDADGVGGDVGRLYACGGGVDARLGDGSEAGGGGDLGGVGLDAGGGGDVRLTSMYANAQSCSGGAMIIMIIMGAASGIQAGNGSGERALLFFCVFLRGCCSSVHGRWF